MRLFLWIIIIAILLSMAVAHAARTVVDDVVSAFAHSRY